MNQPRNRVLRTLAIAACTVFALTAGWAAEGAGPGYVFYYHTFGDWVVICALDEPTGNKDCRLGAPNPSFGGAIGDRVDVDISEPIGGDTLVVLRVAPVVDANRPARLIVDGQTRHQAVLTRTGETAWRAPEAHTILAEMMTGHTLSIRFVRQGNPVEIERQFSLVGFAAARRTYQQQLAAIAQAPR